MGRDHRTGLPNKLIPCPLGARNTSDSCKKSRCQYVFIPLRDKSSIDNNTGNDYIQKLWTKFLFVILILMFIKFLVFFFGACYSFFLSY